MISSYPVIKLELDSCLSCERVYQWPWFKFELCWRLLFCELISKVLSMLSSFMYLFFKWRKQKRLSVFMSRPFWQQIYLMDRTEIQYTHTHIHTIYHQKCDRHIQFTLKCYLKEKHYFNVYLTSRQLSLP